MAQTQMENRLYHFEIEMIKRPFSTFTVQSLLYLLKSNTVWEKNTAKPQLNIFLVGLTQAVMRDNKQAVGGNA